MREKVQNLFARESGRVAHAISVIAFTLSPPRRGRLWQWAEKEIQMQTPSEPSTSTSSRQTSLNTLRSPLPSRISWAAEPFADEDTPLLGSDKTKDPRPRRKSRRNSFKALFKKRLAAVRPIYDHGDIEDDEEEKRSCFWIMVAIFVLAVMVVTAMFIGPEALPTQPYGTTSITPPWPTQRSNNPAVLIKASHGAVATENPLCSDIGVQVLKDGGNAVDAAVASTLCIGVVNMFSSGIGGGGFMTVRIPSANGSEIWTIDFRERAPAASNSTMYEKDPILAIFGGLSVAVPGELRGLEEA